MRCFYETKTHFKKMFANKYAELTDVSNVTGNVADLQLIYSFCKGLKTMETHSYTSFITEDLPYERVENK